MQKICKQCKMQFEITKDDLAFYDKVSPVIAGKKYQIPPPTLCSDCRQMRRLSFRNERALYVRKCDLCQRDIVSTSHQDSEYKSYCSDCWWGDKWDPREYGMEIDFSRSILSQIKELDLKIPHLSLIATPDTESNNSAYVNFAGFNKNCYLIFDSDKNEDCYYSNLINSCRDCVECSSLRDSELCFQAVDSRNCYNVFYSQDCDNCRDSRYLMGCTGCKDCYLSCNLRNQQYCYKNKRYSKEEYEKIISDSDVSQEDYLEFCRGYIKKYQQAINAQSCSGNMLYNSSNCSHCYDVLNCENLKYCDSLSNTKNSADISSFGADMENSYECCSVGVNEYGMRFCFISVLNCRDLLYCIDCRKTKDSFGSVSLKGGQYYILNKQYSSEEYTKLVERLIDQMRENNEWGEFFPMSASRFDYRETVANDHFPIKLEGDKCIVSRAGDSFNIASGDIIITDRIGQGKNEREDTNKFLRQDGKVFKRDALHVDSKEIINRPFVCAESKRSYKIIQQEFDFYRKHDLPLPIYHPDIRHAHRMKLRNPRHLWDRTCGKCSETIKTTYAPERKEKVHCEKCYLESIN